MSEMVERVAAIIAPQAWCMGYSPQERQWSISMARAAIDAMRKPTNDMWNAASDSAMPELVWEQMIDAALAE